MGVCVFVCPSHEPIGPQLYPAIYVVTNPVRALLGGKIPEEHLQSFNESMTTKQQQNKNDKNKGTKIQRTCQKNIEGHPIEKVCVYVFLCVLHMSRSGLNLTQQYTYVVANPVRARLDGKIPEEHLMESL